MCLCASTHLRSTLPRGHLCVSDLGRQLNYTLSLQNFQNLVKYLFDKLLREKSLSRIATYVLVTWCHLVSAAGPQQSSGDGLLRTGDSRLRLRTL